MTSDQITLVMTEKSSKPQAIQSNSRQALAPETLPIVIVTTIIIHSPRFQTKFQRGVRESSTATWVHMLRTQYAFLRGVTLLLQTNHHEWSNVLGPRNNHPQWMNFAGNSGEAVKQICLPWNFRTFHCLPSGKLEVNPRWNRWNSTSLVESRRATRSRRAQAAMLEIPSQTCTNGPWFFATNQGP